MTTDLHGLIKGAELQLRRLADDADERLSLALLCAADELWAATTTGADLDEANRCLAQRRQALTRSASSSPSGPSRPDMRSGR